MIAPEAYLEGCPAMVLNTILFYLTRYDLSVIIPPVCRHTIEKVLIIHHEFF